MDIGHANSDMAKPAPQPARIAGSPAGARRRLLQPTRAAA
jgi:hypothetical protein